MAKNFCITNYEILQVPVGKHPQFFAPWFDNYFEPWLSVFPL